MAIGLVHVHKHGGAARIPGGLEELEGGPWKLGEGEKGEEEGGGVLQHTLPPPPQEEEPPNTGEGWVPLLWPMLGTMGSWRFGFGFRRFAIPVSARMGDIIILPEQGEKEPVDVKVEEVKSPILNCGRFNAAPGRDITRAWQSLEYKKNRGSASCYGGPNPPHDKSAFSEKRRCNTNRV